MKVNTNTGKRTLNQAGKAYLLRLFLQSISQAVIFFVAAGTLLIPRAYLFFAVTFTVTAVGSMFLKKYNPELLEERAVDRSNTESWDKILLGIYIIIAFYGINCIAGIDMRLSLVKPGIIFFIPAMISISPHRRWGYGLWV